ncbi:ArsC family reductase [Acerihabitans sp. TG2]|uniref:ArsC family reductase n=1 Tax=Acerihabitans sp. TG2 TaxID=3096008 RepID=UPI002B223734|nr:ArsC family reductase [Acerihabitans sp. TG2]MEA9389023.1 ArsC family reductase [Acerihabitans sp. TG2]
MADSNAETSLRVYGIKNCDTIKKARRWLEERDIDYQFHDYRRDGVSRDLLLDFINRVGWEVLLNTRGTTWRKLSEEQRLAADKVEGALELMLTQPSIIKRPVLQSKDGHLLVGFSLETYQQFFFREA